MAAGPDYRVYGEIKGVAPEAWERLAGDCPLETAEYADGVLTLEHEGRWADVEGFLEARAETFGPEASGHCDAIDNDAWTITRYVVDKGLMTSQTFGINDVLENTVKEGNL